MAFTIIWSTPDIENLNEKINIQMNMNAEDKKISGVLQIKINAEDKKISVVLANKGPSPTLVRMI